MADTLTFPTAGPASPEASSGVLKTKHLKTYISDQRRSFVGPTSVYYAGVTAPVISGGMATLVLAGLGQTSLGPMWSLLIAVNLACLAGVCWYLIFMRWSYRRGVSRDAETGEEVSVVLGDDTLVIERAGVRVSAHWSSISEVCVGKDYLAIRLPGTNDVVLPSDWFETREAFRAFAETLSARTG